MLDPGRELDRLNLTLRWWRGLLPALSPQPQNHRRATLFGVSGWRRYGLQVSSDITSLAGGLLALSDRSAGVPLRELALVGLTAAIITYFVTGPVRVLATRLGAVAYPRERDVHVTPTPRMGGLAMFVGVVSAVFLASQLPALTRGFVYSSGMPAVLVAKAR